MKKKSGCFANRLKATREKIGMSQVDLAKKSKLTRFAICHFEAGRREPNLENLTKIVKALGVSADVLLGIRSHE